ncbi:MAG TPA: TonB-dependent receptor [Rhizomicrobium sp.]|nr:TonB-dependent receptor [Rhizomicrobium sp.]
MPALAQIETVVVTAEKRSEDVQSVPIAVTAYSAEDLAAHQVNEFKDIQFSTPNVSYTKGNFTGSNFQIRGIGLTGVGYDAEAGVAVHQDDVFLVNPPLAEANFYDLERVEVLRGPQSTLYGRGATGGSVNIITAKPQLDSFAAAAEGSYGNYNSSELKGMVNIPLITDVAGLRLAGDWVRHDGYTTNIADNSKIDSQDTYSLRGTLRFKPTSDTTIDITGAYSHEADSKMRARKQYCATDPTGILGCLPDELNGGVVNLNSTLATIASSKQSMALLGNSINPALVPLFQQMGLFDLQTQPTLPAPLDVLNPPDLRKVNTDFTPTYHARDEFIAINVKQRVTDWLDATFVGGYDYHATFSQESYNNVGGQPFTVAQLNAAHAALTTVLSTLPFGGPAYASNYDFFFSQPGALPVSGVGGLGITSGNIGGYFNQVSASDQSDLSSQQYSAELRFNTNFEGPLNAMVAGYYLRATSHGSYYVVANTFDYPFMIVGAVQGALGPFAGLPAGLCTNGCIDPGYYHNDGTFNGLTSKAIFGEVYFDAIPDELKFTAGLRFTDDEKNQTGRIFIFPGVVPLGTPSEAAAAEQLVARGAADFDASVPGNQLYQVNRVSFNKWTGRFVASWSPKLDFTDSTNIYASYARGYKAGGFNPGIQPDLQAIIGVPAAYLPESVNAFELGTKNIIAQAIQANISAWYYDYKNLQVSTIIANTSVNQNVDAKLWGFEGEFLYAPTDTLQFNLNIGYTNSKIGDSQIVDQRNPTAGRSDAVLIKDAILGGSISQNCVLYMINGQTLSPADNAAFRTATGGLFFAPPGGSSALAAHGVALANYGACATAGAAAIPEAALNAFGYSRIDPKDPGAGVAIAGVKQSLSGNELQNTPPWTISVGAQYRIDLDGGYSITPRADFYWQADMWGRIFNTRADKIKSGEMTNALITFSAPENAWYVAAYIKNVFDEANVTGEYLTSASSGLYTNLFLSDPRTFGVRVGANF